MRAPVRICQTVDAAVAPARISLARRRTRTRIDRMVRGRPGRFGRDILAWRRRSRSRCQRRIVSGRTSRRSLCRVWSGRRCRSAASDMRSAGVNRGLVILPWRSQARQPTPGAIIAGRDCNAALWNLTGFDGDVRQTGQAQGCSTAELWGTRWKLLVVLLRPDREAVEHGAAECGRVGARHHTDVLCGRGRGNVRTAHLAPRHPVVEADRAGEQGAGLDEP
jgi:hypothetical protein